MYEGAFVLALLDAMGFCNGLGTAKVSKIEPTLACDELSDDAFEVFK